MVSTVQIVCTGRKIISQLLKIDGSFFVPYFTLISLSDFSNKDRCTACLYGMVSRIIMLSFSTALPRCFPKASAKVVLFFISANYLKRKITKIQHFSSKTPKPPYIRAYFEQTKGEKQEKWQ